MMTTDERIQKLAEEANGWLTHIAKPGGRDGETIVVCKDGHPEWVKDLCHRAHGEMFPDDWRYEFIEDVLGALEDGADEDRLDIDSLYPYTASRLQWFASRLDRNSYCDEAAEEMGERPAEILTWVAWGMDRELREVYDLIRSRLAEMAEEQEEDADDE